jgi:hypothetical protein
MHAWAGSLRRVTEVGSTVIIKAHRDRHVPFATLLPEFAIVREADAELPGIVNDTPIASVLVVLRRER